MMTRPPKNLDSTVALLVAQVCPGAPPLQPEVCNAIHNAVLIQLFQAVARGDLSAARRTRDALQATQPFIDKQQFILSDPQASAVMLSNLLGVAQLATEGLEVVAIERGVEHPESQTRAIFSALLRSPEFAYTQREICGKIWTHYIESEIAEYLHTLTRLGFLTRQRIPTEDGRELTYYAISERGMQLCRDRGIRASEPPKQEANP